MWNNELLNQIDRADDLKIAPERADGKTGTPTWIWEVAVDGRLFVRAYSGTSSSWYKSAAAFGKGQIHAVGQVFDVRFIPVSDDQLNDQIDQAYRTKYASSRYMQDMIRPSCRAATVEILPIK